jgi:hypothetical protein
VVVAEGVADLVADEVFTVGGEVAVVGVGSLAPALGVDDGVAVLPARQCEADVQGQAAFAGEGGAGQGDPEVGGAVGDALESGAPAAGVVEGPVDGGGEPGGVEGQSAFDFDEVVDGGAVVSRWWCGGAGGGV